MASPFPGMDPYLEGDMWVEFHHTLANKISEQLIRESLPPSYVALLSRRYVVDETLPGGPSRSFDEVPVLGIKIVEVATRRTVTIIELRSPFDKIGLGAVEYAKRRADLLLTDTHLLEIDLLRRGARLGLEGALPSGDYYVYLSRFTHRPYTDVWPIALRDRLPVVPVPLLPPDEDVPLDLQRAVDACFELVRYERLLDYSAPPPPPLSEADGAWLASLVNQPLGQ